MNPKPDSVAVIVAEMRETSHRTLQAATDKCGEWADRLAALSTSATTVEVPVVVGFVSQKSIDMLNLCRNDDYPGTVDLWTRSTTDNTIPIYTRPGAAVPEDQVLALLIAGGFVTQAKVDEARLIIDSTAQPPRNQTMSSELEKIADDLSRHADTLRKGNVIDMINADTIAAIADRIRASLPAADGDGQAMVGSAEAMGVGDLLYRINTYCLAGGLSDADFRSNAAPILEDVRGYLSGLGYEPAVWPESERTTTPHPAAGSGGDAVLDRPARVAGRDFFPGALVAQVVGRAHAHYDVQHANPAAPQGEQKLPWLRPLGALVSAALDRDLSAEDHRAQVNAAHSALYEAITTQQPAGGEITDEMVGGLYDELFLTGKHLHDKVPIDPKAIIRRHFMSVLRGEG